MRDLGLGVRLSGFGAQGLGCLAFRVLGALKVQDGQVFKDLGFRDSGSRSLGFRV